MKTIITTLSAATLLSLAACAKQDELATNAIVEEPAGNFKVAGNDGTFASNDVLLPQENATDLNATDLDAAVPANGTGNTF